MKNYIFYFVLLMNMVALQAQSTDRDPLAALEVRSTTQGFLPPRMSTAQRVAIVSPTDGLIVYDNDLSKMMFRANGKWVAIGSTALASPLTASIT